MKTALAAMLAFALSIPSFALTVDKKDVSLSVTTGQTGSETIVVTNEQTVPAMNLHIDFFEAGGEAGARAFPIVRSTTCGKELAAGASCEVKIDFSPERRGAYWAVLDVNAKKMASAYAVIEGRTELVTAPTLGLEFSRERMDYRVQALGFRVYEYLVLTNRDVIPVDINRIAVLQGTLSGFNYENISCGKTLDVGARCVLGVWMWPQSGVREIDLHGRLIVETRDYDYDIPLRGSCFTDNQGRCRN